LNDLVDFVLIEVIWNLVNWTNQYSILFVKTILNQSFEQLIGFKITKKHKMLLLLVDATLSVT